MIESCLYGMAPITNYQLLIAPRGSRSYGTGGFEAVGTTPGQHWINAENLWRGKTR